MRTSLYTILCIGIRLAAVLLFVNALLGMPAAFGLLGEAGWHTAPATAALLYAIILIVAFLLWVYPGLLARLAAGKASREVFESPIDSTDAQVIAFSVLGLWLFCGGVLEVLRDLAREFLIGQSLAADNPGLDVSHYYHPFWIGTILIDVVQVLMGASVLLGARGLTGALQRLRHAGLKVPPREETSQ